MADGQAKEIWRKCCVDEAGQVPFSRSAHVEAAAARQQARLRLADLLRWIRDGRPDGDLRLFADPAWDLLVEVYSRHLGDDDRTTIHELSAALGMSGTLTGRWIVVLESRGWLQRLYGAEGDVTLTASAHDRLNAYIDRLPAGIATFTGD